MAYLSEYVPAATERGPAWFPSGVFPESALWNRQMAGGVLRRWGEVKSIREPEGEGHEPNSGWGSWCLPWPVCFAQPSLFRPQPATRLPKHPTTTVSFPASPGRGSGPRTSGRPPACLGVHPTGTRRQGEVPGTVKDPESQPLLCVFSVDGDPHFIIQIPEKDDAICFNIDEDPGTVLRLIQDPVTGGGHGLGPGALPETAWSPQGGHMGQAHSAPNAPIFKGRFHPVGISCSIHSHRARGNGETVRVKACLGLWAGLTLGVRNSVFLDNTPWPRQGAVPQGGPSATSVIPICLGTDRTGSQILVCQLRDLGPPLGYPSGGLAEGEAVTLKDQSGLRSCWSLIAPPIWQASQLTGRSLVRRQAAQIPRPEGLTLANWALPVLRWTSGLR